jgi:hypothetical protein
MKRLIGVAALLAGQCLGGCTPPRYARLPADTNPNDLVAAIALRGRGEAPPEPVAPGPSPVSPVLSKSLEVLEYAGIVCLGVPVVALLILAKLSQSGAGPYR